MSSRYFLDQPLTVGLVQLEAEEAHHLGHVMRVQLGDEILLFDGQGHEALAIVRQVERDKILLETAELLEVDRELPFPLVLAVALPRGDRQKWLVEKLVELGVTELLPVVTERGVAQPVSKAIERLQRTVIEASKQSGRTRLMKINSPCSLAQLLEDEADADCRLIADPGPTSQQFERLGGEKPGGGRIVAAVGPEGGFSPSEMELADQAGWQRTRLGERILRVETAAIALAALLACSHDAAASSGPDSR